MYLVILVFMAIMIILMIDHDRSCTTHHAILRRNVTIMSEMVIMVILMIVMHDDQDLEMEQL